MTSRLAYHSGGLVLKIKDIKTAVVNTGDLPYMPKGTPVGRDYNWVIVRVITDEGIDGYGETYYDPEAEAQIQGNKPRLIGEDPTNLNKINALTGTQALWQSRWRSGVEIACWDILGKSLDAPLYKLFGGKYRDKIRIYADSGGHLGWGVGSPDPKEFQRRAKQVLAKGFTAIKFDIDPPEHWSWAYNRSVSEEELKRFVKQVQAVRDTIGDEMPLAIDCHWKYSVDDVIKIGRRFEQFNLWWLEDPVPHGNIDALLTVKNSIKTPVSVGETMTNRYEFRPLIEKQATSMIGPDSRHTGGLLEFKAICDMADLYFMPVAPHNMTTPIGCLATAHVCAAMKNFVGLEFHFQDVPWWDDMSKSPHPVIDRGFVTVPEKPGIGVELNKQVLLKHITRGKDFFS